MHIPTCETGEIEIADFAPALEQALAPAADYDVQKWLFVPNKYDEYRYILGTLPSALRCLTGLTVLLCSMFTPSARPIPTIWKRILTRICTKKTKRRLPMHSVFAKATDRRFGRRGAILWKSENI